MTRPIPAAARPTPAPGCRPASANHRLIGTLALVLVLAASAGAAAQAPSPAEAADYLGTWTLSTTIQGNPVALTLEIAEVSGTLRAALASAMRPEPQLIDEIKRTDAGLDFAYDASFDGSSLRIHLEAALAEGRLGGTFGDEQGLFSAPFTGERAAEPAGIVTAALAAGDDSNGQQQQQRRSRRRLGSSQAELAIGEKKVRVLYGELSSGSADHESFLALAEGDVFEYAGSRCMKLFSDLDLHFGETKIATENVAPGYPGVYSLWLRKTADGWRLVFNQEGDVWGTMHDPAKDVAEVPLEMAKLDAPQQQLEVTLAAERESGGVLRIAWGDTAWSARFDTRR